MSIEKRSYVNVVVSKEMHKAWFDHCSALEVNSADYVRSLLKAELGDDYDLGRLRLWATSAILKKPKRK